MGPEKIVIDDIKAQEEMDIKNIIYTLKNAKKLGSEELRKKYAEYLPKEGDKEK